MFWWVEAIDNFHNKSISHVWQLWANFSTQQRIARVKVSAFSNDIPFVAFLFWREAKEENVAGQISV